MSGLSFLKALTAWSIIFTFTVLSFSSPCTGLPQDYSVESGDASFELADNTLTITASDQAIINFGSFSIAANETVRFLQPDSASSVLSRVTGSSSSEIFGSLFSNGELMLINPNGIHFGSTAHVEVGSLIASTLAIQSANYLSGQYLFEKEAGMDAASIFNEGSLTAADVGHIALLSESIRNTGTVTAELGSVVLGVGEKQTLSFGDGLVYLVIDRGALEGAIQNQGTLSANGGKIILNAQMLNDTFNILINNQGILEATRVYEHDGVIELVSNGGIESTGELRADILFEEGASFDIGGVFHTGTSYIRNLDNAITYSSNTSVSGTITDVGNIIVNAGVQLSLDGTTWLKADSDGDASGAFTMGAGSSIAGNGNSFRVSGAGTSTIASIQNVSSFTLDHSYTGGVIAYTMLENLSLGSGTLAILGPGVSLDMGSYSLTTAALSFGSGSIEGTGTWVINGILSLNGGSTLSAPSSLTVSGTFSNAGTFTHNSGTVILNGSDQNVLGSTTFYNLTKNVTSAATMTFEEGTTQTIAGTLNLQGTAGNLLSLRSSNAGTQWNLKPEGTVTLSYLDVKDSNNTSTALSTINATYSANSGNNTDWTFVNPPAPAVETAEAESESQIASQESENQEETAGAVSPGEASGMEKNEAAVSPAVGEKISQMENLSESDKELLVEFIDENSSDVVLSADGATAYIANSSNDTIKVVDLKKKTVIGVISTGTGPASILLTQSSMFVFNRLDQSVFKINPMTGEKEKMVTIGAPGDKSGIPASKEYVELLMNDSLMNQFLKDSPFPESLTANKGKTVYLLNKSMDLISVINSESGRTEATLRANAQKAAGFPINQISIQLLMNDGLMNEFLR